MKTYNTQQILDVMINIYNITSENFTKISLHDLFYIKNKLSAAFPTVMKRNGYLIEGNKRGEFKWGYDHQPTEIDASRLYDLYKNYVKESTRRYRNKSKLINISPKQSDRMKISSLFTKGLTSEDEKERAIYKRIYEGVSEIIKLG